MERQVRHRGPRAVSVSQRVPGGGSHGQWVWGQRLDGSCMGMQIEGRSLHSFKHTCRNRKAGVASIVRKTVV